MTYAYWHTTTVQGLPRHPPTATLAAVVAHHYHSVGGVLGKGGGGDTIGGGGYTVGGGGYTRSGGQCKNTVDNLGKEEGGV